jgi:hypothetical protein
MHGFKLAHARLSGTWEAAESSTSFEALGFRFRATSFREEVGGSEDGGFETHKASRAWGPLRSA